LPGREKSEGKSLSWTSARADIVGMEGTVCREGG